MFGAGYPSANCIGLGSQGDFGYMPWIRMGELAQELIDMAPDYPSGYNNLA